MLVENDDERFKIEKPLAAVINHGLKRNGKRLSAKQIWRFKKKRRANYLNPLLSFQPGVSRIFLYLKNINDWANKKLNFYAYVHSVKLVILANNQRIQIELGNVFIFEHHNRALFDYAFQF